MNGTVWMTCIYRVSTVGRIEQAVGADRPSASVLKIRNSGGRSTAALGKLVIFNLLK